MKHTYLNNLADKIHTDAVNNGFYDDKRQVGTLLMLVVSELSEALEADRNRLYNNSDTALPDKIPGINTKKFPQWFKDNVKNTFNDEIADAIIRLLDICGYFGIDIDRHIQLKLAYNKTRGYKHGKNY